MIKMLNAYTAEVEDAEDALAEILGQIDLSSLLKNSAGILACHHEFIETGVAGEICRRLPFDVIGCTTIGSAVCGSFGLYQLSLTILTSDDVSFSAATAAAILPDHFEQPIADAYASAAAGMPGAPSLIISFFPFLFDVSNAVLLSSLNKICGGAPVVGAAACEGGSNENLWTLRNGQCEKRAVQMLLIYGDVEPEFITISLPARNIRHQKAVITQADGVVIRKVNNMPLMEYFASMGIIQSKKPSFTDMPLLIHYGNDSPPVAVGIYGFAEDGSAICGGDIPQGATLSIGVIDREGIMETAKAAIKKALSAAGRNGLLMFPCITRYLMLSPDSDEEVHLIRDAIGREMPYALSYAGGELCPVHDSDGELHNRLHNYSFTACVF